MLRPAHFEEGTTLVEIMVVMLITGVVAALASTALVSLSNTADRVDTRVTDQQAATTVVDQVARDIRSAHQVLFDGFASPAPAQEIELQMNAPITPHTWVEWVYTPTSATINGVSQAAGTLARYVSTTSSSAGFAWSPPNVSTPVNVVNGSAIPVFEYFQGNGSQLTDPASINSCATWVMVSLDVSADTKVSGIPTLRLSEDVAVTDQALRWGSLPCS